MRGTDDEEVPILKRVDHRDLARAGHACDADNAILSAAGYNFSWLLSLLMLLLALIANTLLTIIKLRSA
jgi:hypothetical protein